MFAKQRGMAGMILFEATIALIEEFVGDAEVICSFEDLVSDL